MTTRDLIPEASEYLSTHPTVDAQLKRAEKLYGLFGKYLNLTQNRVIIRESAGSTLEADPNAEVSRTTF